MKIYEKLQEKIVGMTSFYLLVDNKYQAIYEPTTRTAIYCTGRDLIYEYDVDLEKAVAWINSDQ